MKKERDGQRDMKLEKERRDRETEKIRKFITQIGSSIPLSLHGWGLL